MFSSYDFKLITTSNFWILTPWLWIPVFLEATVFLLVWQSLRVVLFSCLISIVFEWKMYMCFLHVGSLINSYALPCMHTVFSKNISASLTPTCYFYKGGGILLTHMLKQIFLPAAHWCCQPLIWLYAPT